MKFIADSPKGLNIDNPVCNAGLLANTSADSVGVELFLVTLRGSTPTEL